MKRPDLLLPIAIWRFITAFLASIGIIAIAVFAFPGAIEHTTIGALFGLSIALTVLLAYVSLSVAAGIGLIKGKSWGRALAIVCAILDSFSFPFGTIIGVLTLIYLLRKEVKEYFATP